ncbi:MAG: hypothetical protein WCS86_00065 [Candidatus Paceibacterota bacterium]
MARRHRKKIFTLEEWFVRATRSGRSYLTVPPYINELLCGCKREKGEKEFTLCYTQNVWKHNGCKSNIPMLLPKVRQPDPLFHITHKGIVVPLGDGKALRLKVNG